ncbi:PepSY-associated TM helix domain-containing protein [Afipia birgiae]|uniref:PepSY-associated TM helix domain-containing protein n=1 Tax=Afipia birgiae TaxID=151414 RepID=UPI0002EB256D|nr:PepSY-associated TM helix domain-containing protein [Afipia birgiae]
MSVRAHQTDVNTIPSAITRHAAAWRRRTRFVLLRLHRWLGLGIGILLVLIGLTGSFNVFYREIDAALNPVLYSPAGPERDASIDDVLSAAAEADSARIAAILAPDRVWPVWVVMHIHRGEEGSYPARWTTMVDPSNGRVLGRRDYTNSFAFTIYRLHYTLLLYPWWGRELVGVIGIGLLCSALSGLYLWWPRNGRFWRSVSLRKGASPRRRLIDLHNAAGFWAMPALIVLAVTGIGTVFPNVVRPLVGLVSTATPYPAPTVTAPVGAQPLPASRIVAIARAAQPERVIAVLNPPDGLRNTWRVLFRPPHADPALRSRGGIWLDPWTGTLVHDRTPDSMAMGDRYITEQLWLHNGATFGLFGRLIIFASGLVPLALFATGWAVWSDRRSWFRQRPIKHLWT